MATILPTKKIYPTIPESCFLAPNATIIGDVILGNHSSVWFQAVVRGDVNYIRIGEYTNIQDGVIIHCTYQKTGTDIGSYVNVGHNAIIHGCTLKDHVLIGMGAIVMDNAVVEPYVIIAAGAVVLENTVCETGFLYAGIPAKKIKPLTEEQRQMLQKLPHNYVKYSKWFSTDSENQK